MLIIVGGVGFFYLYSINHPSSSTPNTVTPPSNAATSDVAATATTLANNTNATNTATASSTATVTVTPTTGSYVQLKSYYSGTASGYTDGAVTFSLKSEDQQGNVNMQTTFQQLGGNQTTDIYTCQGTVTTDRHLNLQCVSVSDSTYVLTVQGRHQADEQRGQIITQSMTRAGIRDDSKRFIETDQGSLFEQGSLFLLRDD